MKKKYVLRLITLVSLIMIMFSIYIERHSSFLYLKFPSKVLAQTIFQQSCLPGSFPIAALTFRVSNGNIVQMGCADISGDLYINGIVYVAQGGNIQASINMLPSGTTGGGMLKIPCGNYTGPTSFISSLVLIGESGPHSIGITNCHVTFLYTAPLVIGGITNLRWENITLDWAGQVNASSTASLVLEDVSEGYFSNISLNQCGGTNAQCLNLLADLSSTVRTVFNDFYNLQMYANSATTGLNQGPAKACILIQGTGPVNNGPSPTLNHFYHTWCRGFMVGGIDAEINSDTNYFWGFDQLYEGGTCPTNSYLLGFNLNTPASDQDADGSFYYGVNYTATCTPTSIIRGGLSFGNLIQFTPTGGNVPVILLGTTIAYTLFTTPLNSNIADIAVGNGRLSACASSSPCPVAGQTSGDISAWRTATTGVLFLGNDAGNISRINSFDFAFIGTGGGGATMRTAAFTFATLPAAPNGAITWCSDCNATCTAGAGTGRNCSRENGAWTGF